MWEILGKYDCVREHQNRDRTLRATLSLLGPLLYNIEQREATGFAYDENIVLPANAYRVYTGA